MRPGDGKLIPVIRGAEAAERQAGEELRRISTVYDERSRTVEALREKLTVLEKRRDALQKEAFVAKQRGVWARVAESQTFSNRIGKEALEVRNELGERERDLEQARVRATQAEQELLKTRIEKRKVESLLAQRVAEQRLRESAQEEAFLDEVSVTHAPRRKD